MDGSRDLFTRFLKGETLSRPAFVPLIRGLLARVEGEPLERLTSDPTLWANSLLKTFQLFGFDGLVVGFDFSLMAEACGCKIAWHNDRPEVVAPPVCLCGTPEEGGRMKHALEATRRVFQVCGHACACAASLTGPATLASQLFGRDNGSKHIGDVKEPLVRMTEAFCLTRPDMLIFMEGRPLALAELNLTHRRIYNTLKNIAAYYNIPVGLYLQGYLPESVSRFAQLNMDVYILGPSLDKSMLPLSELRDLAAEAIGVGLSLPLDDPEITKAIINQGLELCRTGGGQGFFFTSSGKVSRDADLEMLRQITEEIRQLRL